MTRVRAVSAELREAIAAQSFEHAGALLAEYTSAVQRAAAPAAITEALDVLAGLRRLALARRAHLAARLEELNRVAPYLKSAPPRRRLYTEG